MSDLLTKEGLYYIVSRLLDNANDAVMESKEKKDDAFLAGKRLAYYEVLDTIKNELIVRDMDLEEFNIDIILEELL